MNSTSLFSPLALACVMGASIQAQEAEPRIDFTRLLVVGDSLSAGFQNASLMGSQQVNGYAYLVATQAESELAMPLIYEPGIPNVLVLIDPGPPPVIEEAPGVSAGRIDPTLQATNLGVPGHTVRDALELRPDFLFDDLTDLVLGLPGAFTGTSMSQVEWAEALEPTAVFVWLGNNDTLGAALDGDASLVTPQDDFEAAFAEVMDRMSATGAALVVANIPDVTVIPYLSSYEEVVTLLALFGVPGELVGPVLGIGPGDFVTPDAFELMFAIFAGAISGPLPPDVVLDAREVKAIQGATARFNAFIERQAKEHGAALVDINALLNGLACRGLVVGGQRLTVDFLGGLFSLDGFHPTNTGYALIANEFIKTMNRRFDADVAPVSVRQVMRDDPLVFGEPGHVGSEVCTMSHSEVKELRKVMRPRR